ncbi:Uncharacterised protein [Mycobacterium tuberculosis]|nr:Uncharacterised protein [Mycobacterium tuberculosis]
MAANTMSAYWTGKSLRWRECWKTASNSPRFLLR